MLRKSNPSQARVAAAADAWANARADADEICRRFEEGHEQCTTDHILFDDGDFVDVDELLEADFGGYGTRCLELASKSLSASRWVRRGHLRHSDLVAADGAGEGLPRHYGPTNAQSAQRIAVGTARELRARAELVDRLGILRAAVDDYKQALGPIGHNSGHTPLELDETVPPSLKPVEDALNIINDELRAVQPSVIAIQRASRGLRAWAGVWNWFKEKADRAVNSVVDQTGSIVKWAVVAAAVCASGDKLATCALETQHASEEWQSSLTEEIESTALRGRLEFAANSPRRETPSALSSDRRRPRRQR